MPSFQETELSMACSVTELGRHFRLRLPRLVWPFDRSQGERIPQLSHKLSTRIPGFVLRTLVVSDYPGNSGFGQIQIQILRLRSGVWTSHFGCCGLPRKTVVWN